MDRRVMREALGRGKGEIMKIVYTKPTLTKAKVTLQAVTAKVITTGAT